MTKQPTVEEFNALREAMESLQSAHESLVGESRVLRVERDLLKERLAKMIHKMFAAQTEALGTEQKDMVFNESQAQAAATVAAPAQEVIQSGLIPNSSFH